MYILVTFRREELGCRLRVTTDVARVAGVLYGLRKDFPNNLAY
jgi:hypothetical protein